jgi:FkbM family methyltransferase
VSDVDLEAKFRQAVECLHASPLKKLARIGSERFLRREYARAFGVATECKADLFFGKSMTVVLPEIISQQIYTYGFFDEIVTGMALRAVRQRDVVLDVGAHFGYFTLLFAHLVGESGQVVSFEPTPSTFSVLRKNTADVKHVSALNAAAGRQSGRLTISDFGLTYSAWNTLSGSSRMPGVLAEPKARVEVDVIRLDDWCARESLRPDVIKIDAENFEAEVIGGLTETLSSCRPRVLMETGSEQAIEAGRALLDLDYRVLVSDQPGVLRLQADGVEDALVKNKDVLFVPAENAGEFVRSA